jgi:hypothetical protein
MTRICNKAKSALCPDPRGCRMATPHECRHRKGLCLQPDGYTLRVRCVELPKPPKAPKTRKGAE